MAKMRVVLEGALWQPNLMLITGRPGTGKTFTAWVFMAWNLLNGGYGIANGRLIRWLNPDDAKPAGATYPHFSPATTLVDILVMISEILHENEGRKVHIVLLIDEAQSALDALSF